MTVDTAPVRRSSWRWGALFVGVSVLMNVITWALEPQLETARSNGNPGSILRARGLLNSGDPAGVVFMGSSLAAFGFDPVLAQQEIAKSTGITTRALNLGIFAADVDINYLILKNLIADDRKPSVIAYGISDFELNSAQPASNSRQAALAPLLAMDDIGDFSGDGLPSKIDFVLSRMLPIYRDGELIHQDLGIDSIPPPLGFTATDQGYFPSPKGRLIPAAWPNPAVSDPLFRQPYQFEGHRLDRLRAFLDLARSRDIKVVLVSMPVTALRRSYWRSAADLQRYVGTIQSVARESATPLLDLYMNTGDRIPADGFLDSYHVNGEGSRILTTLLARDYLAPALRKH